MSKIYHIKLKDGSLVPVSEEVYRAYKRPQWREMKRIKKKAKKESMKRPLSYDQLIESEYQSGKSRFRPAPSAEELAGDVIELEMLRSALEKLVEEELALVKALFYEQLSEREYAKSIGVSQKTVNRRREKILIKLRKLIDTKN